MWISPYLISEQFNNIHILNLMRVLEKDPFEPVGW